MRGFRASKQDTTKKILGLSRKRRKPKPWTDDAMRWRPKGRT